MPLTTPHITPQAGKQPVVSATQDTVPPTVIAIPTSSGIPGSTLGHVAVSLPPPRGLPGSTPGLIYVQTPFSHTPTAGSYFPKGLPTTPYAYYYLPPPSVTNPPTTHVWWADPQYTSQAPFAQGIPLTHALHPGLITSGLLGGFAAGTVLPVPHPGSAGTYTNLTDPLPSPRNLNSPVIYPRHLSNAN